MATVITSSEGAVEGVHPGIATPTLLLGRSASVSAASKSIRHDIIGRADPDFTLRPASSRTGTYELLFTDETAAEQAFVMLGRAAVFTIADDDRPTLAMTAVTDGRITKALADDGTTWLVSWSFCEVAP